MVLLGCVVVALRRLMCVVAGRIILKRKEKENSTFHKCSINFNCELLGQTENKARVKIELNIGEM